MHSWQGRCALRKKLFSNWNTPSYEHVIWWMLSVFRKESRGIRAVVSISPRTLPKLYAWIYIPRRELRIQAEREVVEAPTVAGQVRGNVRVYMWNMNSKEKSFCCWDYAVYSTFRRTRVHGRLCMETRFVFRLAWRHWTGRSFSRFVQSIVLSQGKATASVQFEILLPLRHRWCERLFCLTQLSIHLA